MKRSKVIKKRALMTIILVFSLGSVSVTSAQAESENAKNKEVNKELSTSPSPLPDKNNATLTNITKTVNDLISRENEIGQLLVKQLTDNDTNLSNAQKTEIIEALGNLRYAPAIPILVENLNFEREAREEHPLQTAVPPLRSIYAAQFALMSMGPRASSYILGSLANNLSYLSSDYVSSRAIGFARVLCQVEGPRYGLLKLQDHQQKATDPKIKAQYQLVIDKFEEIIKQTQ